MTTESDRHSAGIAAHRLHRHRGSEGLPWPGPTRGGRAEPSSLSSYRPHLAIVTSAAAWRGSGVSFYHIASGLRDLGWRVTVLSTCGEVVEHLRDAGIAVVRLPSGAREQWRLRTFVRAEDVRIVMADRPHDLRVASRALIGVPVRLVLRYNLSRPRPVSDLETRIAFRWRVDETVFLSHQARRQVLDSAPFMKRVPSRVIHEGIELSMFRRSARAAAEFRMAHGLGGEAFLLAVGALSPEKRYPWLLDAVARLGPAAPELVVCGKGSERDDLEQRARALGVRCRWLGELPREQLVGAYSAASALVHGCAVETFGLAVVEAMACEAPVVAVGAGAVTEVAGLSGEAGFLVHPDDPGVMTDAVRELLTWSGMARAMGQRGRARVEARFSLPAMIRRYDAVCAALVHGPAAANRRSDDDSLAPRVAAQVSFR